MIHFRSGKKLDANKGFVGLNEQFEMSEGYDSIIGREKDDDDFPGFQPLTREECIELCDVMLARWKAFRNSLMR